ncbi:MAG: methyltransferase domain-containing protein [Candidatus Methanoperedens sp.]|nr:methyltransferase domain-containing protein [Candidatus Methanoperedens sp.]
MKISIEDMLELSDVETLHPGGLELSRRIAELIKFNLSMRVLDVSSGKGIFACMYAKDYGCRVTGIDIKQQFIDIAIKRAEKEGVADKVDFRLGDSRKLPFPDGYFDVAINECAVGLTAINDPAKVLSEMVRVTKTGGKVVIHESIWLKELPLEDKEKLSMQLGTAPYSVDEWKQMLINAGAMPEIVEDWSGIENVQKMRPGFKWNPKDPSDFLTAKEKLALFTRIIMKYGLLSLFEINRIRKNMTNISKDGYLGYVLIIGSKR